MQQQQQVDPKMQKAAELLRNAGRVVVFSGAGMSADSGVATFRKAGSGGLWGGIRGSIALAYFGTPFGWNVTPGLAWQSYCQEFYGPIAQAKPHAGHLALAQLEAQKFGPEKMTVVTMNVDGFHSRAGNTNVVEVHGTVERFICKQHGAFPMPHTPNPSEASKIRCPQCGGTVRPDVVLFTEALPEDEWYKASRAVQDLGREDVLLVIGTTGTVYPAAGLPESAIMKGVNVIEINMDSSPITHAVDVFLQGKAGEIVPKLVDLCLQA